MGLFRDPTTFMGFVSPKTPKFAATGTCITPRQRKENVEDETFERFRELMKDPERRPVLVHCSSANRWGHC